MNRRDFFKRMAGAAAAVSSGGVAGFLLGKYGRPDGESIIIDASAGTIVLTLPDAHAVRHPEHEVARRPQLMLRPGDELVILEATGNDWKVTEYRD